MDRVLEVRRPPEQSQVALSRASKIFFGCDIFQVIAVVVFQGSMIALGDFSAYNNTQHPGMGPGRRIYMAMYMGAVVYTCFLCLFAVKKQNFMEIIAFDLQNFAFVTYSFIQLYHVKFKTYNGLRTSENDSLPKIVIGNAATLLLLNIVFTYLSYKLYMEFGWKIYKRVRFNIKLRGIYQIYELLSCLLKIEILYWGMYAVVHSLVLLRDTHNVLFFLSLSFIPLSLIYAGLGFYATRRENRFLMIFFLSLTIGGIGYFLYKLYGFVTRKCSGCAEFMENGKDIPSEAFMHFVYLGTVNLLVLIAIFGVALKTYRNFGGGLAQHFNRKKPQLKLSAQYDLNLGRGSHNYPEESVISVTSYEFDEFGESVRLDRGLLHPGMAALPTLTEGGQNLIDKRSCSLPNLLPELPARSSPFLSTSGENGSVFLQIPKDKSAARVITSICEEKPVENNVKDTQECIKNIKCDEVCEQDSENGAKSPSNGHAVAPIRKNGCVKGRAQTYQETHLAPEKKQNGHLLGKTRFKTSETNAEQCQCELQAVNRTNCHCGSVDNQFSKQSSTQEVVGENPLLDRNQTYLRTAGNGRSSNSCSDGEVFVS